MNVSSESMPRCYEEKMGWIHPHLFAIHTDSRSNSKKNFPAFHLLSAGAEAFQSSTTFHSTPPVKNSHGRPGAHTSTGLAHASGFSSLAQLINLPCLALVWPKRAVCVLGSALKQPGNALPVTIQSLAAAPSSQSTQTRICIPVSAWLLQAWQVAACRFFNTMTKIIVVAAESQG